MGPQMSDAVASCATLDRGTEHAGKPLSRVVSPDEGNHGDQSDHQDRGNNTPLKPGPGERGGSVDAQTNTLRAKSGPDLSESDGNGGENDPRCRDQEKQRAVDLVDGGPCIRQDRDPLEEGDHGNQDTNNSEKGHFDHPGQSCRYSKFSASTLGHPAQSGLFFEPRTSRPVKASYPTPWTHSVSEDAPALEAEIYDARGDRVPGLDHLDQYIAALIVSSVNIVAAVRSA